MKIDVLYQFNEKYAPYAGASITSLFENNKHIDIIRIFVLGEALSADSVEKLRNLVSQYKREILFPDTGIVISKMKAMNLPSYRGSYAANIRLFLTDILDNSVERILYLDADTIIQDKLDKLINFNMKTYPIAMALDSLVINHKKDIGLNKDDYYFNSGVILFEMSNWRNQKCTENIVKHICTSRSYYPAPDQDLLNIVCNNNILRLPPQYNFQPIHEVFTIQEYYNNYPQKGYYTKEEVSKAKEKPVIYHFFRFLGEFPWNKDNLHPFCELFDRYILLSPWYAYEKISADSGILMKIEKLLFKSLPKSIFIIVFKLAHQVFVYRANQKSIKKEIPQNM